MTDRAPMTTSASAPSGPVRDSSFRILPSFDIGHSSLLLRFTPRHTQEHFLQPQLFFLPSDHFHPEYPARSHLFAHALGRAGVDQFPLLDDRDAIAERLEFAEDVRGDD